MMKIRALELVEHSLRIMWSAPFLCLVGFLVKLNVSPGRLFGDGALFSDLSPVIAVFGMLLVVLCLAMLQALAGAHLITCANLASERIPFRFSDGLRGATRAFPRMMGLSILSIPIFLPAACVGAYVYRSYRVGNPILIATLVVCTLVFLFWAGATIRLAKRECVIELKSPLASLKGGLRIFASNPWSILVLWLTENALAVVLLVCLCAVGVILTLACTVGFGLAGMAVPWVLTSAGGGLMVAVAAGIAGGFSQTFWTLAYLKLAGSEQPAKDRE
ncbi:hypothetical protein ACFL1X_14510 [Candidatus Hydrogenedentota bacterium]